MATGGITDEGVLPLVAGRLCARAVLLVLVGTLWMLACPMVAHAADDSSAYAMITEGTAGYADNTLLFFRSSESYSNDSDATVTCTDIAGNVYRGIVYPGIESDTYPHSGQPWYEHRKEIGAVAFAPGQVIRPVSTACWFQYLSSVREIVIPETLDTSRVTSMSCMFDGCTGATRIDVTNLDTANVTDMYAMFFNCWSVSSLDLSHFDTRKVTGMSCLFYRVKVSSLDLSSFRTPALTSAGNMFYECTQLVDLDLSSFDLSRLSNAYRMFYKCTSLSAIDLSTADLSGVVNASELFLGCSSLEHVELCGFDTSMVTNLSGAFSGCTALRELDLTGFDLSSRTVNLTNVFQGCAALERVWMPATSAASAATLAFPAYAIAGRTTAGRWANLGDPGTTYEAGVAVGTALAAGRYGWAAYAVWRLTGDDMGDIVNNAPTELHLAMQPTNDVDEGWQELRSDYTFNGANGPRPPWLTTAASIERVILDSGVWGLTSANALFSQMPNVTAFINLDHLDTSAVTRMTDMFYNDSSVTAVDVTHFDFANVVDMAAMFQGCAALTSVEFSRISSPHLVRTWAMFNGCSSLTHVRLGSLHMGSPEGLGGSAQGQTRMFISCEKLVELDLSSCDLSDVVAADSSGMFSGCASLERILLPDDAERGASGTWFRFPSWRGGGRWMRADDPTTAYVANANLGNVILTGAYVRKTVAMWRLTGEGGVDDGGTSELHLAAQPEGAAPTGWAVIDSDYTYSGKRPGWSSYSSSIRRVVLDNRVCGLTSGNSLFYNLVNVTEFVNLDQLDTSAMTDMRNMFCSVRMATAIDVSQFDVRHVTDMAGFFQECKSLTEADLSGFDGSSLTTTFLMFGGCTSLRRVRAGSVITPATVETRLTFQNCTSLVELDLSSCTLSVQSASDLQTMLRGCTALERIMLPAGPVAGFCFPDSIAGARWSNAATNESFDAGVSMGATSFAGGTYRRDVLVRVWCLTSGSGGATELHLQCQFANDVAHGWSVVAEAYAATSPPPWRAYAASIGTVVIDAPVLGATSTAYWFADLVNVEAIEGLSRLSTAKVTDLSHMFDGCSRLTAIDLTSFDTRGAASLEGMLDGCDSLARISFDSLRRFHADGDGTATSGKGFRLPGYGTPQGFTGRWANDTMGYAAQSDLGDAVLTGTWVRQRAFVVMFDLSGGQGTVAGVSGGAIDVAEMPQAGDALRPRRRLLGWSADGESPAPSWVGRGRPTISELLSAAGVNAR